MQVGSAGLDVLRMYICVASYQIFCARIHNHCEGGLLLQACCAMSSTFPRTGFAREHYPALLTALDHLLSHCSAHLQGYCHGNGNDPRVVRLCRKLGLSEKVRGSQTLVAERLSWRS